MSRPLTLRPRIEMKPRRGLAFALVPLLAIAACHGEPSAAPTPPTTQASATQASAAQASAAPADSAPADGGYVEGVASRDGIGKFYCGREISHVMGHLAADWLERGERQAEERTDLLLDNLDLRPADVVADVGAGSGYFTFRLAPRVPQGKVLAVDIQPEMLAMIEATRRLRGQANVATLLGTITDPTLPRGGVDVALLVDAYHEFDHPREMMSAIADSLAPGGRVVLVEYRGEDDAVPIKPLHKMTQAQAIREMRVVGLRHLETRDVLPQQHLMIFAK